MSTPAKKEFGPGYDYPDRKFHLLAVILPTVLIIALAVVLVRRAGAPSSQVTRSPVVACPAQTCPPPESTASPKPSARSTQAAKKTSSSSSAPPAALVLSVTGTVLSRAPSAVTHAVVLSSA